MRTVIENISKETKYALNNPYKTLVEVIKVENGTIFGEWYDWRKRETKTGKWLLKDLHPLVGSPKILAYEHTEVDVEELDWSILPDELTSLTQFENGDWWGNSALVYYDAKDGSWKDPNGAERWVWVDKAYNLKLKTAKPCSHMHTRPERFETKRLDPEEEAIKAGNTKCHCGAILTDPFYWNGIFYGFKCEDCAVKMAYESLEDL